MIQRQKHACMIIQAAARSHIICGFRDAKSCVDCECPICIEQIDSGIRLSCGHTFHIKCICRWMQRERSCPICRRLIRNVAVEKVEQQLVHFKHMFTFPVESLLCFTSAIPLEVLSPVNLEGILAGCRRFFIKVIRNNFVCRRTVLALYENCKILLSLREEIRDFDEDGFALRDLSANDAVTAVILRRLKLPFEHLYGRVRDKLWELRTLETHATTILHKILRGRLCKLWAIEKCVQSFSASLRPIFAQSLLRRISALGPFADDEGPRD